MPHFFISPDDIHGTSFRLQGPEARHIARVLRHVPGDEIELFDGTGKAYRARIDTIDGDDIRGTVVSERTAPHARLRISLYQAVPKGDRFDWLVEKIAELGVDTVIPLITERSVLKEFSEAKIERWRRLSQAASKQSGRNDILTVAKPLLFNDALTMIKQESFNIIPWESEQSVSIPDSWLPERTTREASIFIGPEGGFTLDEINAAKKAGVLPVS
ncbi:MAG TPA: RsmE family RNA methyltransferase, partial [bacterium]|nr:RsmE family RNA methyltransferase [bacterium]